MTAQHKIKWGISTLGCHELDLRSTCQLAESHGIHFLEIRSLADSLNLPEYLDRAFPNGAIEAVQVLEEHQQSIIALNSGFKLIETDPGARVELLEFARWAELLGVPLIRVFGGGDMSHPLEPGDFNAAVANLDWWEQQRQKEGWSTQIALETHGGFSSSERCLQLDKAYDGQLRIIWDTHHTWKLGGESAEETWRKIGALVEHVHVKDSISVPSARHPYSYVLPGKGEFPIGNVFSVLRASGFDGVVSLEWERKWHPYMPELDEALEMLCDSGWRVGMPQSTVG